MMTDEFVAAPQEQTMVWWAAGIGWIVGGVMCSAITALAIFGSHHLFCGN
jgi:hypothetical protein